MCCTLLMPSLDAILNRAHIGRYLNGNGKVLWASIQGSTDRIHTPRNPITNEEIVAKFSQRMKCKSANVMLALRPGPVLQNS